MKLLHTPLHTWRLCIAALLTACVALPALAQKDAPKSPRPATIPAHPSMQAPPSPSPAVVPSQSGGLVDAARGPVPILETNRPPRLGNQVNDDERQPRNYDRQPPVVPHRVDGYQIDKNFNKCLDCHSREQSEFSHAVPVGESHYVDRDGRVLNHVSTRRYFCLQCHVPQENARPLVGNTFRGLPLPATTPPQATPSSPTK